MAVTVTQLRGWDIDGLRAAGAGLRAASRELDVLASRLLPHAAAAIWTGVAAESAQRHMQRVRRAVAEIAAGLDACGAVLGAAAEALAGARRALDRAASYASDSMLHLSEDGTVVVPPIGLGLPPEMLAAAERLHSARQRLAAVVSALAQQALAAAEEADRDAAHGLETAGRAAGLLGPAALGWLAVWAAGLSGPALRVLLTAGLVPGVLERDLPAADADAVDVAAWWASLTPMQQDIALRAHADRLGGLDGLPVDVRHRANVAVLDGERAALLSAIREEPPFDRLVELLAQLGTVESVSRQLAGDPARRRLLLLDIDAGRAAIAIGDVDRADHVAVLVPGLDQDVAEDMDALVYNADRLGRTAADWLHRLAPDESVATVAWLGYDTPSIATVASTAAAERGGRQLRSTLTGLRATRESTRIAGTAAELHLTVVGHSYGSVVTAVALREPSGTDDAVLVGSPGVGVATAGEVGVPRGHVYVGETPQDRVADLGWFGADPSERRFGAVTMQTDGGADPVTGSTMRAARGHSQYFDLHTESVRNIALVAIGQSHHVTYVDGSGAGAADAPMQWGFG